MQVYINLGVLLSFHKINQLFLYKYFLLKKNCLSLSEFLTIKTMKKIFYLFILIPFLFSSCTKEDIDVRNNYIGSNWDATINGSLIMYYNGSILTTTPLNYTDSNVEISKNGEDELIIDGETAYVSGSRITFDPVTHTETNDGITMQITENKTGKLGDNIITVNSDISGNWNYNGESGILSGSYTVTFSR